MLPPTRTVILLLLALAACGAETGDGGERDSGSGNSGSGTPTSSAAHDENGAYAATPTFARDVANVVYDSCTPCHRPGGPAPFSLLGYDDVYKRRKNLLEVVEDRLMPPWLPTHGDFVDDRRLSDETIAMLRRWCDAGAPRGDAAAEPAPPTFETEWQLGAPDAVVEMQQAVAVPADGPDLFRNFVLPAPVDSERYVAAVEIRPGSPAVHHAVLCVDASGAARARDRSEPGQGFAGMDMAGALPPDGYFLGWTPGKRTRRSPDGMSWRLQPGQDLVLQMHLTPTGRSESFRPRIGLWFTDRPPAVASYPLSMFVAEIDLPPGATDVVVRDHVTLPVPVRVHSVYPHAHYLCTRMAAWAELPDGGRRELFRIDRWDFDWQDDYRYEQPIALPKGARIAYEYTFDNSADNPANPSRPPVHVRLGDRSVDEMANLTLQVTTDDFDARRTLGEAAVRRGLQKLGYDRALLVELAVLLRERRRLDQALAELDRVLAREPDASDAWVERGNCLFQAERLPEAAEAYRRCLQIDDDNFVARVQLASALWRSGQVAPAIEIYEDAARRYPAAAAVHVNLATAYLSADRMPDAERSYRRAIDLDPGYFQAWFYLGRILSVTGRADEARTALERALELRPGDPRARQALDALGR